MKKLIPAFAMLLMSAVLLSTASFAWFSMNTVVTATNMQVKAVADQGILINEVPTASDANWDSAATTSQSEGIILHATSTANTASWYVAHSKVSNDAAAATAGHASSNLTDGYKVLGTDIATGQSTVAAVSGSNAQHIITFVDADADNAYDNGEGYYVMYTYYIKSSAGAITTLFDANGQTFNIKTVTATSTSATSADLDKSLRVAIVINGKAYIYAPVSGATGTYYVNASSTATTVLDSTVSTPTALATIPASTDAGTPVQVYLYFEGEDTNLKTSNITTALDTMIVEIQFELKTNDTAVTDPGVVIPTP